MSGLHATLAGAHRVSPVANYHPTGTSRWAVAVCGLVGLFVLLGIAARLAIDPARFPVIQVDVLGTLDYANREALIASTSVHTREGFYGLDIDRLRETVESIDWIARARVSRVWPARISIEVDEHEPAARWNDDHLISKQMVLFKPYQLDRQSDDFERWSEVFRSLPQVLGVQGRHVALLDAYRAYEQSLSRFGLSLSLLREDERLSRTLVLSNGVVVRLGLKDIELRMERFMDVYERIAEQNPGMTLSFDMRYSSGFALGVVTPDEN